MSLAKLFYILITTVALHMSHTPPATALKEERVPNRSFWDKYLGATVILIYIKALYWTVAFLEIAGIVADEIPLSQIPGNSGLPTLLLDSTKSTYLTPLSTAGMFLIVSGALLRWQCFRTLKNLFTFEHTIRKDHKLVTSGPYSVVRHPSYSGAIAIYAGVPCWYGSQGSWLRESGVLETTTGKVLLLSFTAIMGTIVTSLLMRMKKEDASLREVFKGEWDEWARKVPNSLIPYVY